MGRKRKNLSSPTKFADNSFDNEDIFKQLLPKIIDTIKSILKPMVAKLNHCKCNCSSKNVLDSTEHERFKSIVISGIHEQAGKVSERCIKDYKAIDNLIDEIGVDAKPVTIFRMRTKIEGKPRFIKCVLKTTDQQKSLKKLKKFKE